MIKLAILCFGINITDVQKAAIQLDRGGVVDVQLKRIGNPNTWGGNGVGLISGSNIPHPRVAEEVAERSFLVVLGKSFSTTGHAFFNAGNVPTRIVRYQNGADLKELLDAKLKELDLAA